MLEFKTIVQYKELICDKENFINHLKKEGQKYISFYRSENKKLFFLKKEYNQAIKFYKENPIEFYKSICKDYFLKELQNIFYSIWDNIYDIFEVELEIIELLEDENTCFFTCTLINKRLKKEISFNYYIITDNVDYYSYENIKDEWDDRYDDMEIWLMVGEDTKLCFCKDYFFEYLVIEYLNGE